jgi:large subunit ribosomal protein L7Ae
MPSSRSSKSSSRAAPVPLFQSTPRSYRVGGDIQHKRDVSRFVRWPKYVRIQRQKKILQQRLKVPPALNQFNFAMTKAQAATAIALFKKYQPEDRKAKALRLKEAAASGAGARAPIAVVKFGLNHVTTLVETRKAKLVLIASDVDPIELVVWLPALCRKMDVPFAIVRNKSRLGQLVNQKTATCVCLTRVETADQKALESIAASAKTSFNANMTFVAGTGKGWGGGIMGLKTQRMLDARKKAVALELGKKETFQ